MGPSGPARRLSVYVGERETYDGKPLYQALVEAARTAGVAGATVLRGIEGFGASSREEARHDLRMSEDLPVVVVAIDEPHKIEALAEVYCAMVGPGLITVQDVEIVAYRGTGDADTPQG
jgi:PII-like signaling protein